MSYHRLRNNIILLSLCYIFIFYIIIICKIQPFYKYIDFFKLIGNCISLPLFYLCIHQHEQEKKIPWIWFAFAGIIFLIGDVLAAIYVYYFEQQPDIPSICDVFYLIESLACCWAFLCYMRTFDRINIIHMSIDMFITGFAALGLIYIFIFDPIVNSKSVDTVTMCIQLLYPICNIATMFGILILFFNSKPQKFFKLQHLYMMISFIIMCMCDFCKIFESLDEYTSISFIYPIWSISYLLIALAGLCDLDTQNNTNKSNQSNQLSTEMDLKLINRTLILENLKIIVPFIIVFTLLIFMGIKYKLYNIVYIWTVILIFIFSIYHVFIIIKNRFLLQKIQMHEYKLNIQNMKLHELNRKIMYDSQIDFLTQLFNRKYIAEIFKILTPSQDSCQLIGVLLIDVDFFKTVNDTYGHQIGDTVLQSVAQNITSSIKESDYAGRFGGDEFIVIAPDADCNNVTEIAQRLHDNILNDDTLSKFHVTISIGGISCKVTKYNYNIDMLVKHADKALYTSKENGKNCYNILEISL